jgi:hypothetical protein
VSTTLMPCLGGRACAIIRQAAAASRRIAMPRPMVEHAALLAGGLLFAGVAAAQSGGTMKATAPEKMTPPGEGAAMRECDKMAMEQHIKMEDHTRFVQDCIAKKMK